MDDPNWQPSRDYGNGQVEWETPRCGDKFCAECWEAGGQGGEELIGLRMMVYPDPDVTIFFTFTYSAVKNEF